MASMMNGKIKKYLPRTLYGRAAAILLLPMLTLQLAVAGIFVQRHFEGVTRQMTQNLIRDINVVLKSEDRQITAWSLGLTIATFDGVPLQDERVFYDISGLTVIETFHQNLNGVQSVDMSEIDRIHVFVTHSETLYKISFPRRLVATRNPHQVLVWMVFTGIFMTIIAYFFLRNQLRPIKRMAHAATAFGHGQVVAYNPSGAIEVRAAGLAFLDMRARIERFMEQRTMMLSGVSHDLRTPLTRLQLALSMSSDPEAQEMLRDVEDMQKMIEGFLTFSRDATVEEVAQTDIVSLVQEIAGRMSVPMSVMGDARVMPLRPMAVQRCLENVLSNAQRYASEIQMNLTFRRKRLIIEIHDNGPGIPPDQYEEALRPFVRLEPARNQNRGSGVGLGLALAVDVARAHGGKLELDQSPDLGGLLVRITLPFQAD